MCRLLNAGFTAQQITRLVQYKQAIRAGLFYDWPRLALPCLWGSSDNESLYKYRMD